MIPSVRIVSDGGHDTHIYDEYMQELEFVKSVTLEFEAGRPVMAYITLIRKLDGGIDIKPQTWETKIETI